jgi:hypothetical protein
MRRFVAALLLVALVALPVSAQRVFVSTVVIGMSTRQANDYSFSPVVIPLDVKGLEITMDLSEAPDPPAVLPAISASLECSLDGGTTWDGAGGFSRTASPKSMNRLGTALQQTTGASFAGGNCWSATTNPNRRLRGSASIGGQLRFALTVRPL